MNDTPQAYPLQWPPGKKRTAAGSRRRAAFGKQKTEYHTTSAGEQWSHARKGSLSVADALARVGRELDKTGAYSYVVSTNLETRLDGLPRSGQRKPDDPGVAVYFWMPDRVGKSMSVALACDLYTTVEDNIAAIAAHLNATRAIERHGVGTFDELFMGFRALPPASDEWREVLGNPETIAAAEINYRELSKLAHPDVVGGDAEVQRQLNAAIATARAVLS